MKKLQIPIYGGEYNELQYITVRVPDDLTVMYIGLHIIASSEEYLRKMAEEIKDDLPYRFVFPCGKVFELNNFSDLPRENVPCPCGNPNHWFVKYVIDPSLDRRGNA